MTENYPIEVYGVHVKDVSIIKLDTLSDYIYDGEFESSSFAFDYNGLSFDRSDTESEHVLYLYGDKQNKHLYRSDCTGVVLPLSKWPSLTEAVYSSVDEMVDELRENYKDILPKDFDYASNICYAQLVIFG